MPEISAEALVDQATRDAVAALAARVRRRDEAAPDDRPDAEPFAIEFLTALRAQGWRPTPAWPVVPWQRTTPPPSPGTAARGAALARRAIAGETPSPGQGRNENEMERTSQC